MIRNALDNGNFACAVFIDLQKAFDTFNHGIVLSKLNHYGIRGVAFNCIWHNMAYRKAPSQDPYYFSYVNDLSRSIKNSKIHHFADDTNLLNASSSLKDINKKINFDLSILVQWLRANKIALNVNKTDIVIFQSPRQHITKKMNFCLSGQKN